MGRFFGADELAHPLRLFPLANLDIRQRARNEAMIRGLCANAYVGDETLLCRVLGRYKMYVDATDLSLSSHLLLDGYWEMWLTEALAEVVQPGMTVCDIGANLGYFTVLMADLAGESGRVHAFEPNPHMARRLARSVAVNGFQQRVAVHADALSDAEGVFRLVVPEYQPGGGFLVAGGDGTETEGVPVRARRLDSYDELGLPDVIKIDAESSEQAIWRGMAGVLAGGRPLTVFLEFAGVRYADPGAFLDELLAHGFSLSQLTVEEGIREIGREAVLALPAREDVMLVLRR